MRTARQHKLWDAAALLFASMRDRYQSENEKIFFEYLFDVESWDFSMEGDLLLHEDDNEDGLYIMRVDFDEYVVGQDRLTSPGNQHVQSLATALALNLKDCGFLSQDITLGGWLKKRDYVGVRYDQNRDFR